MSAAAEPAQHHVEVIGHRGASADTPEHTLAAYVDAVRIGADAVECDVRMTRDGVLVCVHDRRIDRTSTGRGVVSELTLRQLEQHSFGHRVRRRDALPWRPPSRALRQGMTDEPDRSATGVLTLHSLLDYVTSTPGDVGLAIETKHPTRYSGLVEATLVEDLRRFGLVVGGEPRLLTGGRPAVRVMSFSSTAMFRMRMLAPRVPTVQLMQRVPPPRPRLDALLRSNPVIGPGLGLLRRHPHLVARAHAAGTAVHVWVVNKERDLDFVMGLGVDAVITDRPGALLARLGRGDAGRPSA